MDLRSHASWQAARESRHQHRVSKLMSHISSLSLSPLQITSASFRTRSIGVGVALLLVLFCHFKRS